MPAARPDHVRGPLALFAGWALHDLEEGAAFPATCDWLANRTGIPALRMTSRQSWTAVGMMGALVAVACIRGARTRGDSVLYRATVAGLEAHVGTHVAASLLTRRYTAGVLTAPTLMGPAALIARRDLARGGVALTACDRARGVAMLLQAALACQVLARLLWRRKPTAA